MKRILIITALLASLGLSATAAENWEARWIGKAECLPGPNSWIRFCKTADISAVPAKLEAKIAADTKYWLWINNEPVVFEGGLKRGPAPGDSYYDIVDIAPFLKQGSNEIEVLLWHLGKSGFSHLDSGNAGLLFEAIGDGVRIVSDCSWKANELKAFSEASSGHTNMRLPETSIRFDAREYPPKRMGTPMELPFKVGGAPFGKLVRRPIPMWKVSEEKQYESVVLSGDTLICKLPYNCHITPSLKIEDAPEGVLIRMETDHAVVTATECVRGEYVTKAGKQEYQHLGWMNGEWVYYIIHGQVSGIEVGYRESGYACELSGSWSCDDELLNNYWQKSQRTLYVCMRDTYYDCPDRERAQWIGDEVNELGMAFHMLSPSSTALAVKGLKELVNWQKPGDGVLYGPMPAGNWGRELPMQTLAFIGWYGARALAFQSGDYSFVADIYDGIHRYLHETWQLDADGLPIYRKGGWDWPDAGDNCDSEVLLHPWYYLALKAEKEFAEYLGKTDDAEFDEIIMKKMVPAFNDRYWQGDKYRSAAYKGLTDDRGNAMAVVSGMASPDKYPAIIEVLKNEHHATTYMHRYILEAFCMMGHPELAQELMHYRYPTIMKDECSTLWEHWNFDGTCNHAWSGCGAIIMGEYFAGLKALEPGYRKFTVVPQMGSLKNISSRIETPSGFIELSLARKGKRITLDLTVPEGCTAIVPTRRGEVTLTPGTHTLNI